MKTDGTAIYLNAEEMALFLLFQQYYSQFAFMIQQHAFDIKRGSVILNFSEDGFISSLERREFSYPQKKVVAA